MGRLSLPKTLVIFDLDGVVYRGSAPLPGVPEILNSLRSQGFRLRYLTNNSSQSRASYCQKLGAMGVQVNPVEIMTSAYATALYLVDRGFRGRTAMVVGEG